jgi:hypothetical protein
VWASSLCLAPQYPSPGDWGWEQRDLKWVPFWTGLPDAGRGCSLIYRCGCKTACQRNCKCKKAGIRCSQLCQCRGDCTNNQKHVWSE